MKKRILSLLLCVAMLLTCVSIPYTAAAAEGDLFSDDFESGYTVNEAVGTSKWDTAINAKILQDGDNEFAAFYSEGTQYWPAMHKTVAMTPGQTTCFEGKVKLVDSDTVASQSFYLEYRATSPTGTSYRQQVFNISAKSIIINNNATSHGSVVPDKWIKYTVYVTPGAKGENTKVVAIVDAVDAQSLKNTDGEYVEQLTMEGEKVLDNIYVYQNNKANMVHNNNISDTEYAAMNYLDDVRIYNTGANVLDNTLEYINLDGSLISGFDADKTAYSSVLPYETKSAAIAVKANSEAASVSINGVAAEEITISEFPAEVAITVTPQSGAARTYTVTLRKKTSANEMSSSLVSAKNNAKAIITMVYDDGMVNTAEFNHQMFEKYGLEGSTVIITNTLSGTALTRMQAVVEKGLVDVSSHSTTHTKIDSSYNTAEILKYELVDSKTWLEEKFPSVDTITFAPSNNTITAEGWEVVRDTYWAMRSGNRGYNTLDPVDGTSAGQWYNLYMRGIGDVSTVAERDAWVDTAVKNNNWMIEMWHGIGEGGYQQISKADAEEHYKYISEQQDLGNIAVMSFTNATKYVRERQASTSTAYMIDDSCVGVEVTYDSSDLPTDVFDYPLTVKVEVPEGWGAVESLEDGESVVKTTFTEDGKNYVLANVVPNSDVHTLTKVENSSKLNNIRINGASLSGFDSDTITYDIKVEASEIPVTISGEAQDSNATVTYSNQTVTALPATETVTVTDATGASTVYTLNITRAASTDATLASISINDAKIESFDPAVTSYRVTTAQEADTAIVKAVATDSAYSSVTYDPAADAATPEYVEVSLPATVTIKVTAENGATKTYTVIVESRGGDVLYTEENFESYEENALVTQNDIWDGTNTYDTSGFKAVADPDDADNMIGSAFNVSGGGQNQQLNKYIGGTTTEPVIIRGRYKGSKTDTSSFADFLVRGDGINLVSIGSISNGGNIKVGSTTLTDTYVNGEWMDYIYVIKQGEGKYEITAFFAGAGIGDKIVKASGTSGSNTVADMSTYNCRILVRGNVTNGEGNGLYMDDIKIYSPGVFKLSMPVTEDINLEDVGQFEVKSNHEMDATAVNADTVIITDTEGNTVKPSEVVSSLNGFTVKFTSYVPDGGYTLSLAESATDIAGQTLSNAVTFTVKNTAYDAIEALAVGASGVLEQPYDNLSEVTFTATPTPGENINARQITWYVNDVAQDANGTEFKFTPSECGESYVVYAKAGDVESEKLTIVVEEHPIVAITALEISTDGSLNQTITKLAPVKFTAATTPAQYVDNSTIEWYVNNEKQNTTGAEFTYTPAGKGEYAVAAKVGDTVVSNVLTVNVTEKEIAADDVLYYEDFSDTEGTVIAGSGGTAGALETYNLNGEMVGRAWKNTSDQIQYYTGIGTADYKPLYFTGKFMYPVANTGTFNLWFRGSKYFKPFETYTNGGGVKNFGSGTFTTLEAGGWVKYIIILIPNEDNLAESKARMIWSGPGLKSGDYAVGDLITVDMSTSYANNARFMLQYYPTSSTDKSIVMYSDDVTLYKTTCFLATLDKDSITEQSVVINFNHEAMPDTLVKGNITVTDSKGNVAQISDIEVDYADLKSVKINFANKLTAGESYTVSFNDLLIDVAGIPMDNSVKFTAPAAGETLTVVAVGGNISAVVNGGEAEDWFNNKTAVFEMGTEITLTATAESETNTFLFWKDASGAVLSNEEKYSFKMGTDAEIVAVYADSSLGKYVTFKNANGRILAHGLAGSGIKVPENPYINGYKFAGWYTNGEKQELVAGTEINTLENNVEYKAGFIKSSDVYTITVNGDAKEYKYNDVVAAIADAVNEEGEAFMYWTKDEVIVSYDTTYKFYAAHDSVVTAVYGAATEAEKVLVVLNEPQIVDTNRIAFFMERSIPEEYTVIESGILIGSEAGLSLDKYTYKGVAVSKTNKGQFTIRKANVNTSETWYGIGYVIYTDGENIYTSYSKEMSKGL